MRFNNPNITFFTNHNLVSLVTPEADLSYDLATGGILVRLAMRQRANVMHCIYLCLEIRPSLYTTDTLGSIAYIRLF